MNGSGLDLDVCFLLEGTYPYVAGGVSSWVQQLIHGMPEQNFGYVHLGASPERHATPVYDVPDHVVVRREMWLEDRAPPRRRPRLDRALAQAYGDLVDRLANDRDDALDGFVGHAQALRTPGTLDALLRSPEHWEATEQDYRDRAVDQPFLDHVWTWRFLMAPLLRVLATELPDAACYHTCCTGYAGVLGARAALETGRPLLLTEHGIYAKERRIEVHAAEWIKDTSSTDDVLPETRPPHFRHTWDRHFRTLSRICYRHAARIYTLYEQNRLDQIRDGAAAEKLRIVPNGVSLEPFAEAARRRAEERPADAPFTVGFAGRVTPIKDVRTLVTAARLVVDQVPDAVFRIMGPTDEDPDYARQCQELAQALGLGERLRFEGRRDLRVEFADLDVLVLTSISEAQPLVILEAGAVGIPVVTTDVGSCEELLHGRTPDDRALGSGGVLTPIASPGATARALLDLHADPALRARMGAALRERALRHYGMQAMLDTYRTTYQQLGAAPTARMEARRWPASASN